MTTKQDSVSLLDALTRHQVYLEGVKANYGRKFDATIQAIRRDIREAFIDLGDRALDTLSRREVNQFIARLRKLQRKHFNVYTSMLVGELEDFLEADIEVQSYILERTQEHDTKAQGLLAALLTTKGTKKLWESAYNETVQANGMTPEVFLQRFSDGAIFNIESLIRRARANRMTNQQALASIVGSSRLNGRDGYLLKLVTQANAVSATLLQHLAGIIQNRTASLYYDKYVWVSILDSRTSAICLSRSGHIYEYGAGPLPPAHINCRSKTVPYEEDMPEVPASYLAWLKKQPASVIRDILGKERGEAFLAGKLSDDEFPKFMNAAPLTLEGFKAKLSFILAA